MELNRLGFASQFGYGILVVAGYFTAGLIGLLFAIPPGSASVIWPPSGVATAALFVFSLRFWPAVWLAAILVNLTTQVSLGLAVCIATGNTAGAIVSTWLIRRFLGRTLFSTPSGAFRFVIAAAVGCMIAATVGTTSMYFAARIGRGELTQSWATWFLGDMTGLVVVFPLIYALVTRNRNSWRLARLPEFLIGLAILTSLSCMLFGGILSSRQTAQCLYLPIIVLLWPILRFELREVTIGIFLFATAAIWSAIVEAGSIHTKSAFETLFDLQVLVLTFSIAGLSICGLVTAQRAAELASAETQWKLQRESSERDRLEHWFSQLLKAAQDALIIADGQTGRIRLVNRAAETLFGYSAEELVGQEIEILIPERLRVIHQKHRQSYGKAPYVRMMGSNEDLRARKKNGNEFAAQIALGPTSAGDGKVIFCTIRDMTGENNTKRELKDSEERFALAVKGSSAGIWDWDLRTNSVYFSPRWKSILGYAEHEISHQLDEWRTRLHPEDQVRAIKTVENYLKGETTEYELEHRLRHKDGSYRWILARGAVIRDATGKPYRMVGSHLDITDRKTIEQSLRERLAQLIAAEEVQSYLLPKEAPVIPGFDIAGRCFPAEFAAGDDFDFLFLKNGDFVAFISDVSGHGIASAILMAFLHAHLRTLAEYYDDLSELITRANTILESQSSDYNFVTLLAVRLNIEKRQLSSVHCGHPPGFIIGADGEVRFWTKDDGPPLSVFATAEFLESPTVSLAPGDVYVMLTDGLVEAFSPQEDMFGIDRVVETVVKHRTEAASEIIAALRGAVLGHVGTDRLDDDCTIVIIKNLQ